MRKRPLRQRLRLPLMLLGPIVVLLAGAYWYLTTGRYISTDDAYVEAARVAISNEVSGRVAEIDVHDNQRVTTGQVLFSLDQRPFVIAVEEAKAQLASVRLQIEAMKATYQQKKADAAATEATLVYQQRELERQQRLLASGTASQSQYDQSNHAYKIAREQLASKEQDVASTLASLGGDLDIPVGAASNGAARPGSTRPGRAEPVLHGGARSRIRASSPRSSSFRSATGCRASTPEPPRPRCFRWSRPSTSG